MHILKDSSAAVHKLFKFLIFCIQDTDPISALLAGYGHGFMFDKEDNYR